MCQHPKSLHAAIRVTESRHYNRVGIQRQDKGAIHTQEYTSDVLYSFDIKRDEYQ